MSAVGHSSDWSRCECGWTADGAWAIDEAYTHEDATGHQVECGAAVTRAPADVVDGGCPACNLIDFLADWLTWRAMSDRAWSNWPEDREDEPSWAEKLYEIQPRWTGGLLDCFGDGNDPMAEVAALLPLVQCKEHPRLTDTPQGDLP